MQRLNYRLNKRAKIPLYLQLYEQIRQAIYRQELALGDKLPSKRTLCEFLQISQNTVESAYSQLLAEGYIESQPRRGFFVCFQAELEQPKKHPPKRPHFSASNEVEIDFNPNRVDGRAFPFDRWKKAARGVLLGERLNLGDKNGDYALRLQISEYLAASRGVLCDPEQIIIAAGVESCLQQLILLFEQLFPTQNFTYAMEHHGYQNVEKLLQLYHKNLCKLNIGSGSYQFDLDWFIKNKVNVAYLTPSHLYPFGQVLPIHQRQKLIEWASAKSERYIIEDDYDSEFRYQGKPIPALQSLDPNGKVIYLGSFSKLIMPSLRMTFMVLPRPLFMAYQQICGFFNVSVSRFEQLRLANFIQQGEFEKHIHRMRKIYRRKMELICKLLDPYKSQIRYYGEHSGFYLLVELIKTTQNQTALYQLALKQKIKVYPIDEQNRCLFILGFGDLNEQQLEKGVKTLLQIWLE